MSNQPGTIYVQNEQRGTVMVRNCQPGPTVLSTDARGSDYVEWGPRGDVRGEDYQPVSAAIQDSMAFKKAVKRGVLEIVDEAQAEAEILAAETAQQQAWNQRQNLDKSVADAALERSANNDIVALDCIGPNGPSLCGKPVNVREMNKNDHPPLCDEHKSLASEYIPQQDIIGGKPATTWTRFTMGRRETAQ